MCSGAQQTKAYFAPCDRRSIGGPTGKNRPIGSQWPYDRLTCTPITRLSPGAIFRGARSVGQLYLRVRPRTWARGPVFSLRHTLTQLRSKSENTIARRRLRPRAPTHLHQVISTYFGLDSARRRIPSQARRLARPTPERRTSIDASSREGTSEGRATHTTPSSDSATPSHPRQTLY